MRLPPAISLPLRVSTHAKGDRRAAAAPGAYPFGSRLFLRVVGVVAIALVASVSVAVQPISGQESGPTWSVLAPPNGPSGPILERPPNNVAYDATNNRLILFFASNPAVAAGPLPQVWILIDANGLGGQPSWIQLSPSGSPPRSNGLESAVYDPITNRLIVYGGCTANCSPALSEVTTLTNANGLGGPPVWTPVTVTNPQPRDNHSAIYEPLTNSMITFAGGLAFFGTDRNDVRILSNANGSGGSSTWRTLATTGGPPGVREGHSADYDFANNRMIVFGGQDLIRTCCPYNIRDYNDLWVLSDANGQGGSPMWTQLAPAGAPPAARAGHTAVYDSVNNRLIIAGGSSWSNATQNHISHDDIWELSNANGLGGTPLWTRLTPDGAPPGSNNNQAAALDAVNQRMMFYGFAEPPGTPNNSVGVLSFPPPRASVTLELSGPTELAEVGGRYDPNPFTVVGRVVNDGGGIAAGVTLALYLPPGLTLAGGSATQSVGDLAVGEERSVSWSVEASGQGQDTTLSYFAVARATDLGSEAIARQVTIPGAFVVETVVPNRGGNAGSVTVEIQGSGFKEGAIAQLAGVVGQDTAVLSANRIRARFNLSEQAPGTRVIEIVNPGGARVSADAQFTIVAGGEPSVRATLVGPAEVRQRPGAVVPFQVVLSNDGLIDAEGVVVHLRASADEPVAPAPAVVAARASSSSSSLTVPLGGGGSTTFDIVPSQGTVTMDGTTSILASCDTVEFVCEDLARVARTRALDVRSNFFSVRNANFAVLSAIGGAACLVPPITEACAALLVIAAPLLPALLDGVKNALLRYEQSYNALIDALKDLNDCLMANGLAPLPLPPFYPTLRLVTTLLDVQLIVEGQYGVPNPPSVPVIVPDFSGPPLQTCPVASRDPNDKYGPTGSGPARYVAGADDLHYQIVFENKPDATAAAQEVVVTDQLDTSHVDPSTFALGPISIGTHQFVPPANLRRLSTDIDLRPENDLVVRVNAGLDEVTGIVEWRFIALNPATGLPPADPRAGFLPPNTTPPEGDGSVSYRAAPRPNLPTGTALPNRARIVFDANDPIDTPEWVVTLDPDAPEVHASRIPAPNANGWNNTDVSVTFDCVDTGSGVAFCSSQAALSVDGPDQQVTGMGTDNVGNGGRTTVGGISIDKTPPVVSAVATAGSSSYESGEWTNSEVTVTFSCTDTLSGVANVSDPVTVTTEGRDQTVSGSCTDRAGNVAAVSFSGINIDRIPPTASCSVTPGNLWPPNHEMVAVTASVTGTDGQSGVAGFSLVSVTSSEPDDGLGDGDTPDDIQGWTLGTPDTNGQLRAERSGRGSGRAYTLTYRGFDNAGNSTSCVATVKVPHNRR